MKSLDETLISVLTKVNLMTHPIEIYCFSSPDQEVQWVSQKCREWQDSGQPFSLVLPTPELTDPLRHALQQQSLVTGATWSGSILSLPIIADLLKQLKTQETQTVLKTARQMETYLTEDNFTTQRTRQALQYFIETLPGKDYDTVYETLWKDVWKYGKIESTLPLLSLINDQEFAQHPLILVHQHMDPNNPVAPEVLQKLSTLLEHHPHPLIITYAKTDALGRELYPLPPLHQYAAERVVTIPGTTAHLIEENPKIAASSNLKALTTQLNDHTWSVTELEDYLHCPFYFFSKRLLKLKPDVWVGEDIPPPVLGESIHKILHHFFANHHKEFITATDQTVEQDELIRKLETVVRNTFKQVQQQHPQIVPALLEQRHERVLATLKKFLQEEWRQLKDDHSFHPHHFEWDFTHTLKLDKKRPLKIKGRVDRIDIDPHLQSFVVIDYKTGQNVTGSSIQKGESLQIPLYIAAGQDTLKMESQGGLFANLGTLAKKDGLLKVSAAKAFGLSPRSSTYTVDEVWQKLFEKLPGKIHKIVDDVQSGLFSLREKTCPPYCEFQEACRVKERDHS